MKTLLTFDISATTGWALFEFDGENWKRTKKGEINVASLTTPVIDKRPFLSNPKRAIEFKKQVKKLLVRHKPDYVGKEALILPKNNSATSLFTMAQLNVIWDDIMAVEGYKPIIVEANAWKDIFAQNGIQIAKNKKNKEESLNLAKKLGMSCEVERARSSKESDDVADASLIGVYIIEKGQKKW